MTVATCEWTGTIPGYDPVATQPAGGYYDADAGDDIVLFYESVLSHIEGSCAGQPFLLEDWQRHLLSALFGFKRKDGSRRYREAFIYVPRKNGKTPLCAGIALYMTAFDGEEGAQVYSAAASQEQASLVYRHAEGMALRNEGLRKHFRPRRSTRQLYHDASGSFFRALPADPGPLHGLNANCVIVDELHAHRDGEVVHTLETAMASRRQPLFVSITTADYGRESICNRKYQYACKVRDGVIEDPSFLPVVFEATNDDDWTDPEVWKKANPNLGVSVNLDYLERECRKAQEEMSYQNQFRRLHLNVITNADVAWLDLATWDQCGEPRYEELVDQCEGESCFGGLDLSKTTDLTCFKLFFPEYRAFLGWYWIPRATAMKAERRDRVPYTAWEQAGWLEFTEGDVVDYDHVEQRIVQICEQYKPHSIGFDSWNAHATAGRLKDQHGIEMVEFRQGYKSMSEPAKCFERLVVSREIRHGGHPLFRWCASNVMVRMDPSGNIKPDKEKSTGRIDGIVAAVMAVGLADFDDGKHGSPWDQEGPMIL